MEGRLSIRQMSTYAILRQVESAPDGLAPADLSIQDEARDRSHSSRRYSSTKTSPTFSPPRRPSASITRLDHRSTWALSRGRVERMSFMPSRSLLPSGEGESKRLLPDTS